MTEWVAARRERRLKAALQVMAIASIVGGWVVWTTALGMVGR